ncbi:MAG: arsenic transporter [Pseudomonadota bacterium]|nr:arsenic transporter [Pseudomonadota bacterium]
MHLGPHHAIWLIAAASIAGVIARPRQLPEALWAVLGAFALVAFSLIPIGEAWSAIRKGTDVYLFLTGMMVLAELARQEGLFDWLSAAAVKRANGSASALFALVYLVGTVVTIFLSNDATAVVLTPAVFAATQRANAPPMPYLFICAFIANAASFVLPISNPANLVVFGAHVPSLPAWLAQFGLASLTSIVVTYVVLRFTQSSALRATIAADSELPALSNGGRFAAGGIAVTAVILLVASGLDWPLGAPTCCAGIGTAGAIFLLTKRSPWRLLGDISWSVLPLVAGLFVLVQGMESTGVLMPAARFLSASSQAHESATALGLGVVAAFLCNVMNNLPLGLIAGSLSASAQLAPALQDALLIGVDLGPNLSVTGSLATILWLVALRREGQDVSAWRFLLLGCLVMPPALLAALATLLGSVHGWR